MQWNPVYDGEEFLGISTQASSLAGQSLTHYATRTQRLRWLNTLSYKDTKTEVK